MKFSKIFQTLVFSAFMLATQLATAQCSMCRAVVESDISGKGSGINNGIVYLMAFPYALVALLAYGLYRKMKNDSKLDATS